VGFAEGVAAPPELDELNEVFGDFEAFKSAVRL
jgi:hypothetical protein